MDLKMALTDREAGELTARLGHVEQDLARINSRIKALEESDHSMVTEALDTKAELKELIRSAVESGVSGLQAYLADAVTKLEARIEAIEAREKAKVEDFVTKAQARKEKLLLSVITLIITFFVTLSLNSLVSWISWITEGGI